MPQLNPKIELSAAVGYPAIGRVEGVYDLEADQVSETLAVNHDVKIDEEGDVDYRKTWNVSHIPTGVAIVRGLPSSQVAKAAAGLLEVMGYGVVTTPDRQAANEQFLALDLSKTKTWLFQQADRSRTSKSLADKIKKRTRSAERGTPPPKAKATKRAPTKKAPRKAAKKKIPKKPKEELDLLVLARKARKARKTRSNPEDLVLDALLAGEAVPYGHEHREGIRWIVGEGWATTEGGYVRLTEKGLERLRSHYPRHVRQAVSNPDKESLLDW